MSFILDALRKSEQQRQRQAGPGLATVPEADPRRGLPLWIVMLGVLLLLNVLVLGALLLTDRAPRRADTDLAATVPAPGAAPRVTPPEPAPSAAPSRQAPLALPTRPPRNEVRPLTTEVAPPAPTAPTRSSTAEPASAPPSRATASAAPAAPDRSAEDARLPRFTDLVVRGELNVPHMHLDIHVWSGNPAERFVFINMRRYNEGQATQEGPRVERIARDGVVMDHQGQRFFLSRD